MELGFIGLGNLGTVMVQNLLEGGRKLHLYNRTVEKMIPFQQQAVLHNSIASLAAACDIVLSIVADDHAVEAIALGEEGLVRHLKKGSVHVCLSTIGPATAGRMAAAHRAQGIDYLTATIMGRPEAARARSLTVCLSGAAQKEEAVLEVLKALGGKYLHHFGSDPKSAAVVKVATNFLILSAIEAMGEAFQLVEKSGGDRTAFYKMITETLFSSPVYANYGRMILEAQFEKAGFTAQLGLKDTRLALELAGEHAVPLPLADLIRNRFYVNNNRGRAQHDWTSIVQVIAEEGR